MRGPLPGLLLAILAAGCGGDRRPLDWPRANVILISLDTLRADHAGLYGYSRDTTPHLDRLAASSVVYDFAISQAPGTLPSHRALFDATFPFRAREDSPTLAEILQRAGYQTQAFTAGGQVSAQFGFDRGFDEYRQIQKTFGESISDFTSWLEENAGSPFLAFLHTYDIHAPYDPPPDYAAMFTAPEYSGPVTGANTLELHRKIRRLFQYEDYEGTVELSVDDRAMFTGLYDGEIRFADGQLGELFAILEERGILDRTLMVIFSDHGEEFWDHGSVSHGHTLYQELIRVPLLIRFPGGAHGGTRIEEPVMLIDVMPTVLEALRLVAPPGLDGVSLLPAIRSGRVMPERPLLSELSQKKALIRYPWKLIMDLQSGERLLFNLRDDPAESQSMVNERPRVAAALEIDLLGMLKGSPAPEIDRSLDEIDLPELREQLRDLGYIQ